MTREEALEKFKAEEADKILKKINRKYFETIVEKRDVLAEILKKPCGIYWKGERTIRILKYRRCNFQY